MPRTEARLKVTIWHNEDYRGLRLGAQWLYTTLLMQGDLSMCGTLTISAKRWASLALDANPQLVEESIGDLEDAGFVVIDDDTDELLIRSFVKHDGPLASSKTRQGMWKAWQTIHSPWLRRHVVDQVPDELVREALDEGWITSHDLNRIPLSDGRGIGVSIGVSRDQEKPQEGISGDRNRTQDMPLRADSDSDSDSDSDPPRARAREHAGPPSDGHDPLDGIDDQLQTWLDRRPALTRTRHDLRKLVVALQTARNRGWPLAAIADTVERDGPIDGTDIARPALLYASRVDRLPDPPRPAQPWQPPDLGEHHPPPPDVKAQIAATLTGGPAGG